MEINVEKSCSNENLKASIPVTECGRYRTTENVEYYSCLGSTIRYDARLTRRIKSMTASIQEEVSFTSILD
jgi:hypothetical protein